MGSGEGVRKVPRPLTGEGTCRRPEYTRTASRALGTEDGVGTEGSQTVSAQGTRSDEVFLLVFERDRKRSSSGEGPGEFFRGGESPKWFRDA